jgi:hypothetical protein
MFDQNGRPTRRGIEARLLIAGLVLIVVLLLWEFYVDAIREIEGAWIQHIYEKAMEEKEGFAMVIATPSIEEYFSSYGLKILIPHDLLLGAYSAAVILSVISIILFARALLALEEKAQDKSKQLINSGMKYFGWVLTLVIFFIIIHLIEESLFPFGTLFQENMWIIIGFSLGITVAVRVLVSKTIGENL